MKLRILKLMENAYDSLYDLQNAKGTSDKYNDVLEDIERRAKQYGYKFKINPSDKWRLYAMNKAEWEQYKNSVKVE